LRDLEGVSSVLVTHQLRDAFYAATHTAVNGAGGLSFVPADEAGRARTEFLMLRDGRVAFEGNADTLRQSTDDYIRAFLS
jgi:hypothetical protein